MNEFEKAELKRKVLIGTGVVVLVGVAILEKRRVDRLLLAAYEASYQNYEDGVNYGIELAKKVLPELNHAA